MSNIWVTLTGQNVALRKESVDRNCAYLRFVAPLNASLSARRAWIEIQVVKLIFALQERSLSARRAWIEINVRPPLGSLVLSLSARRAWIEIQMTGDIALRPSVALRKESVDRNREYCSNT